MRGRLLLMALLCASASLLAQRATSPVFRITGLVVNARDGSPVRRGHVTVNQVEAGRNGFREPLRTETDESGRFLLEVPTAGDWQVNVSAHNVRSQNFEDHEGYFSGVVLTSTAPAYDLVFHAIPDAILTGSVTDEAGEPVRNAQVSLFAINQGAQQTGAQPLQQRQGTQTDDRGRYEFASLEAGSYMIQVQARPWYAGNPAPPRTSATDSVAPAQDPSLDVVYPTTWYPNGIDISAAGTLIASPGDSLQADVRLVPMPSAHLIIPSGVASTGQQVINLARPGQNTGSTEPPTQFRGNPSITLILPNGTTQPVFGQSFSRNQRGDVEIGGLAPGTYQVTVPDAPGSSPRTRIVQLSVGSASIELGAAQQTTPVTISVDGDNRTRASQIVLRSMATGQSFPDLNSQEMRDRFLRDPPGAPPDIQHGRQPVPQRNTQTNPKGRTGGQASGTGGRTRGRAPESEELTLQLPPGKYEVSLSANSNAFLTGVAAKGAAAIGRTVTISESPAYLSVHVGSGFATVQGVASSEGRPCVGAMVLLVPASMGDPADLAHVYRDQTNTDGSFRLDRVIPGPYILVTIDHGWSIPWTNPDTLRPYLMHGTPLDLHSASVANPKLIVLEP